MLFKIKHIFFSNLGIKNKTKQNQSIRFNLLIFHYKINLSTHHKRGIFFLSYHKRCKTVFLPIRKIIDKDKVRPRVLRASFSPIQNFYQVRQVPAKKPQNGPDVLSEQLRAPLNNQSLHKVQARFASYN